jgi:hypothetical protein
MEGSSPEHAVDNNQRFDAVLFSFTNSTNNPVGINLDQIALTWFQNDADLSVFAYTGNGAPNLADPNNPTTYSGSTNGLLNKGWTLVGNYADVQTRPGMTANLAGGANWSTNLVSSHWLVMAYNSASAFSSFGCNLPSGGGSGNSPGCTNGTTSHYDYFKLGLLTDRNGGGGPGGVPEPGSMLLFGTALAGLTWAQRRKAVKK